MVDSGEVSILRPKQTHFHRSQLVRGYKTISANRDRQTNQIGKYCTGAAYTMWHHGTQHCDIMDISTLMFSEWSFGWCQIGCGLQKSISDPLATRLFEILLKESFSIWLLVFPAIGNKAQQLRFTATRGPKSVGMWVAYAVAGLACRITELNPIMHMH